LKPSAGDAEQIMRSEFLLDPSLVFLNHGSFGACPREVLEAQRAWQWEMEANPVAFLARRSAGLLAAARVRLAAQVGADPSHLAFVTNATTGVHVAAHSVALEPGDEVLTTSHEYGACLHIWNRVCHSRGAALRAVAVPLPFDAASFTERIWAKVTPRTRVLFLSHLTSTTALIFPVAELCRRARERGIVTILDGAHVPGHIPLDLDALGADFYTGNCHKWLCAPKGSAFLHVHPRFHGRLEPPVANWGDSAEAEGETAFSAHIGTTRLEHRLLWLGTRDCSAFLAVPAALAFQERHGWIGVRERCHHLLEELVTRMTELTGLGPVCRGADFGQMAIIPVPPMDPVQLKRTQFEEHHIEVPITSYGDRLFVRASIQGYNTPEDAEALVAALRAIYRMG
jgi:isopenicillin-N epimerase